MSGFRASDLLKGLYHSHFGWLFVGRSTDPDSRERYVPDLYRDPLVFRQHMLYFRWVILGLVVPPLIWGVAARSWNGVLLDFL
ncbi:MAG: Fatty acid desaturase (EC; Delta-9 fatty acid desaturase (EC [uncultured Caballeronia sp.]|nr:MAG: Fatty acid desaturase (EC; Delta-9 fatty acid desaturase (EC [uncultured Caballeronia sp.]